MVTFSRDFEENEDTVLTLDDSCEGCISCDQLVLICNQKCSAKGVKTLCGVAISWGRGREDSIDEVTFEISLSRVGVPRVTRGRGRKRVLVELWRRGNRAPAGNRKKGV